MVPLMEPHVNPNPKSQTQSPKFLASPIVGSADRPIQVSYIGASIGKRRVTVWLDPHLIAWDMNR